MVVTDHVDAGKSTLMGHLLFKCTSVSEDDSQIAVDRPPVTIIVTTGHRNFVPTIV